MSRRLLNLLNSAASVPVTALQELIHATRLRRPLSTCIARMSLTNGICADDKVMERKFRWMPSAWCWDGNSRPRISPLVEPRSRIPQFADSFNILQDLQNKH